MKRLALAALLCSVAFPAFAQATPTVTVSDAPSLLKAIAGATATPSYVLVKPGEYVGKIYGTPNSKALVTVSVPGGVQMTLLASHGGGVSTAPGTCPFGGNPYCAGAPAGTGSTSPGAGSALYQHANFFADARQSGQTYTSSHPPGFDVLCVDFSCGSAGPFSDPESVSIPGCSPGYTPTGSYLGGPGIQCFGLTSALTVTGYDFSLHGCLPLEVKGGTTSNDILITLGANKFVNGANCANSGGVSAASGGLVRYDGNSNYHGNMSLMMTDNVLNGLASSFPNELDSLVSFNAPGTGTYQGIRNVYLNAPGRPLGFGPNGGVFSADYFENFVYPPSGLHGEAIINSWSTHPATQATVRYSYAVCLQGSGQQQNGSTTCFYVTPGEAYGTITNAEVDHSIAITNLNSAVKTTSATLAEVAYVTYTNSSFSNNFFDCTGATFCIAQASSPTFTNPTTFTANTCLLDGSTYTAYNVSSTCGATP